MKKLIAVFLFFGFSASAQVAVNTDGTTPDPSAMLDVKSLNKGFLIPRMDSVQRVSIPLPATGLLVYQNTNNSFYYYNGDYWKKLGEDNLGTHTAFQNLSMNGYFVSGDGGNEGLFINSSGFVGVNKTNPAVAMDVSGSMNVSGQAVIDQATVGGGDFRGSYLNGVINCGGGNISYSNILSDTEIPAISFAGGDEDLYIEDDLEVVGTAYKTGGGSWTSLSDERLKKNIEPFSDGLDKVLQIKPVSFQYNESSFVKDQETRYVGVLAQDMLKVAPYTVEEIQMGQKVREVENGVDEIIEQGRLVYTFNPSALDFMLINAVKEQQKMIEELIKLNSELNRRVKELESIK
ncbi:MAG: tail fiber domain-containing protein [Lentimicrobium sp.]